MYLILITVIIGLFVAMLFVNIYFRIRVFRHYKVLVQNKVEFGAAHLFDDQKMEAEIITKYPHLRADIQAFVHNIRYSIKMASVLIFLITAFGAVLMYFRNELN